MWYNLVNAFCCSYFYAEFYERLINCGASFAGRHYSTFNKTVIISLNVITSTQ